MSNRRAMLAMTGLHRLLLRASGHRLGRQLGSMPVIELTTTGRTSGQPRTVLLTVPARDPQSGALIVIASRGGDDLQPAWYLNLVAKPRVGVAAPGEHPQPYRARTADSDERARWWPEAVRAYRGYAQYQRRTTREIPVVILEPEAPAAVDR
jgi:deazaflavin-dependent oxidoreductase (nitroreductase family)